MKEILNELISAVDVEEEEREPEELHKEPGEKKYKRHTTFESRRDRGT